MKWRYVYKYFVGRVQSTLPTKYFVPYLFTKSPQPTCQRGAILYCVVHILTCPSHQHCRSNLVPPPSLHEDITSVDLLFSTVEAIKLFHKIHIIHGVTARTADLVIYYLVKRLRGKKVLSSSTYIYIKKYIHICFSLVPGLTPRSANKAWPMFIFT